MTQKRAYGFTLIELLIVIAITSLITGFSIASYTSYTRKEHIRQAALNLKSTLRFAQTRSIAAQKPQEGCTTYIGMRITFASDGYTVQHQCTEGVIGNGDSTSLPEGIVFSPVPASFTFMVLTRRASLDSDQDITITDGTEEYVLQITSEGEINDQGFQ